MEGVTGKISKNPKLEQRVYELSPKDPCHDFSHTMRVIDLALKIAEAEGGNPEIIYLGALLHDVGRAYPTPGKNHALVGAQMSRDILQEFGYEPALVEAVVHVVGTHSKGAKIPCQSLEAKIVYDADKVDAFGAIGLARLFVNVGHKERPFYSYLPGVAKKTICEGLLAEDREIIANMYTVTGRELANERYQYQLEFFRQMEKEIGYLLVDEK